MTCPFAKFASLLPLGDAKPFHSTYHHSSANAASNKVTMTLSEALKLGTAKSHRAVEKSKGVSMLLHSLGPSSPSAHEEALTFDRADYVKFNIVLACIYIALEAAMRHSSFDPLLSPLFQDSDLVPLLARTSALLRDIDVHLATINLHTGATLAELAQQASETHALASTSAAAAMVDEDIEDPVARARLLQLVQQSLPPALELALGSDTEHTEAGLTADHIALLSPAQIHSTLAYVQVLHSLSTSDARRGLLIAHAYTRYLGDLSGGQHIVRKTSRRFAVDSSLRHASSAVGFEFYSFDADAAELKARFRTAMEKGMALASVSALRVVDQVVDEANQAFDLNTGVFEALVPAHLRLTKTKTKIKEEFHNRPESNTMTQEKVKWAMKVEKSDKDIFVLVVVLLVGAVLMGAGTGWWLPPLSA